MGVDEFQGGSAEVSYYRVDDLNVTQCARKRVGFLIHRRYMSSGLAYSHHLYRLPARAFAHLSPP
jgi:hypothetical protein